MFRRALICTDFADGLHRFANFVPDLVEGGLQELIFFNSVPFRSEGEIPRPDEEAFQRSRDRLAAATQAIPAGATVQIDVVHGSPNEGILHAVETHRPEVLILGTARRSFLTEKLFGSTTMTILKRLKLPLLLIRPQMLAIFSREELVLRCRHLFQSLLIPHTRDAAAEHLIEQIKLHLPPTSGTKQSLLLLKVLAEGGLHELSRGQDFKRASECLNTIKTQLEQFQGVQVEAQVRYGDALREILDIADEGDISAIAIAPAHSNCWLDWSVPDLGQELMRQSWHPILAFPTPK